MWRLWRLPTQGSRDIDAISISTVPISCCVLQDQNILDGDLSDHRLLRWSSHLCRPAPVYTTSVRRCWSLQIILSRHVPGRPADVRLVWRSVLQWPGQRLTRIALRLDHHQATRPTGSYAVCDLPWTPVVLVVRRWMSRCEAEGPASGDSREGNITGNITGNYQ